MDGTGRSLITAFDYVWGRLTGRLDGLTDQEYFWEPVPGCWSLRQGTTGPSWAARPGGPASGAGRGRARRPAR
jgi:hypothetical protein